uniref:Amidase domain-containing protein n=1 Tax=Aureoumbra lagunensis TaxID=44058 RepID=A0A7S3JW98_9STRA
MGENNEATPPLVVNLEDVVDKGMRRALDDSLTTRKRRRKEKHASVYFPLAETKEIEIDLAAAPARHVLHLLKRDIINGEKLVTICRARRDIVDAEIHAVPIFWYEECLANILENSQKKEHISQYLHGLPILIKGSMQFQGAPIFDGFYKNGKIAQKSSAIVQQMQLLGASILGMTNVPEFATGGHTFNNVYPTTVNPYDIRRTVGGSSGGAAAALASRQCWLALGSDLGGSLRVPAAFCGIVGMRPSPGRICRDPPLSNGGKTKRFDLHSIDGPMARSVLDLALAFDCLSQPILSDGLAPGWEGLDEDNAQIIGPQGHTLQLPLPGKTGPPCPLYTWASLAWSGSQKRQACRVAVSALGSSVRSDIMELITDAARLISLEDSPQFVSEPWPLAIAESCFNTLRANSFAQKYKHSDLLNELKPEIVWNATKATQGIDVQKAWHNNKHIIAPAVYEFFLTTDILATPCTIDLPFHKDIRYPTEAIYGNGTTVYEDYMQWLKPCYIVSVTECPAIVLPCGTLDDGLPVGIQLIAKPGDDAILIYMAASLETQLDLDFRLGIEKPRTGSRPLPRVGPTSAQEALEHHAKRKPYETPPPYIQRQLQHHTSAVSTRNSDPGKINHPLPIAQPEARGGSHLRPKFDQQS